MAARFWRTKAEHVIDLKSEVILTAVIDSADVMDNRTLTDRVMTARCHLQAAVGDELTIDGGVAEPDRPTRLRLMGVPE